MYSEQNFISAIEESFRQYKLHGARSTAKLKPIHKFVADTLAMIWGDGYSVRYMNEGGGEVTVDGKYYPKDIDIDEGNGKVGLTNLDKSFSVEVANLLKTKLSLTIFFDEIATYKSYLTTQQ